MNTTLFNSEPKSDVKNYFPIFFYGLATGNRNRLFYPRKAKTIDLCFTLKHFINSPTSCRIPKN